MSPFGHEPCRLAAVGMINALGATTDEIWPRVLAADTSRLTRTENLVPERNLLVGRVHEPLPAIPAELARYDCPNNALTMAAFAAIEGAVAQAFDRYGKHRIGVVMGTSTSGVSAAEDAIRHRERTGHLAPEFYYEQLEFGGAGAFLAAYLGTTGPAYTLSTACSSGARALASARSLLELDLCDAVVCGATDSLCGLTACGFSALGAISDTGINSCSKNRDGTILGEGSALFLMDREPGGVQLVGVGESSDAHHISAPDPAGGGAGAAMREALRDSGLAPADICYLNLHGTGTPANDAMETRAVAALFGSQIPLSSIKALVGHTLGAAGATDAALCWLALTGSSAGRVELPPHVWDGERDEDLPELHLVKVGESVAVGGPTYVMSNAFGFGGNNCSLILAAELS
jgi:3-oxoacyl-[acyl-carrier-protein] synthase-1